MLSSLRSLINKSWLTLLLPVLMLMITLMAIGLPGQGLLERQTQHLAITHHADSQLAAFTMPSLAISPASEQAPQSDSEQPLFFLSSFVEASELSPEGILALLGFTLLYAGALTLAQLKAHALARMHPASFGPVAGPGPSPLFILLQVFRL